MKKYLIVFLVTILFSCSSNSKKDSNDKKTKSIKTIEKIKPIKKFKNTYDKSKISQYKIVKTENSSSKAIEKNLSEYSTSELNNLSSFKRQITTIIVPELISKDYLENTLKYIVDKTTKEDNDIDEILIFAYDNKNDIGKIQYTFGKLVWAPKGKLGNITAEIAKYNIRDNYNFEIDIRKRVGNLKDKTKPTERELEIYNMVMDDKYLDLSEDKLYKIVMKRFKIKSKKELDEICLKVGAYKLF